MSFAEISQVWKTGQTTTYSAGDDGALQKGVAWPSPRFTVNGNGTVTDKLTGLIWSQNAGTPTVGSCTGGALNWNQALSYVACLNSINHLGYNDWRMPNRKELMSLIDYSRTNPALVSEATNTNYFYGMSSIANYLVRKSEHRLGHRRRYGVETGSVDRHHERLSNDTECIHLDRARHELGERGSDDLPVASDV